MRSIPDKAGGGICSLFSYARGAWKFGVAAIVLIFVAICTRMPVGKGREVPPEFIYWRTRSCHTILTGSHAHARDSR